MGDSVPAPYDLLQHAAFVRRLARSLLLDPGAAEDVEQETWRASLEHPPRRGGDSRGWLARVLRNFARRRARSEQRRIARERRGAREEALPPAEAGLEREEMLSRVVEAVRALEEPYRAVILARFYEDMAPRAIAEREGLPLETVNTRLKRGLARVRARLERGEHGWRPALGLLAGESPCLPTLAGRTAALTLMQTKTLAAAAAALALAWGLWQLLESTEPRSAPGVASLPGARVPGPPERTAADGAPADRHVLATSPVGRALAGRVLDERGEPVVAAELFVLGHHDPFGPDDPQPQVGWNAFRGRSFLTDAEGRWWAVLPASVPRETLDCRECHAGAPAALPEPGRVLVTLETSEAYEPEERERWVAVPAEDVDFVVRRVATATLEVRAFEGASRRPLEDFHVGIYGRVVPLPGGGVTYEGGFQGARAEQGLVRLELGVREPAGRRLHVVLSEPRVGSVWARLGLEAAAQPEQEVVLVPGETEEVVFVLPERGVVRGIVVDELGAPVPDALVFFGEETRARGDEPFKPLRAERIRDGARSGADGWFELSGEGTRVTALHDDFSSATVDVERAGRIVLAARGAIRGRLLDADGRPAAGALVLLDAPADGGEWARPATTDATGAFLFEGVEAGAHALWKDEGEILLGVRVAAGAEVEVELSLGPEEPLELDLRGLASEESEALEAVLIGVDERFGLYTLTAGRVEGTLRPGRYWLATRQGYGAAFVVRAGDTRVPVELGQAELRVHSAGGTSLQLVPADADPFVRLMAARVRVRIQEGATARLRAAPGNYLLVGEAGAILRSVELPPGGLALTLE